MIPASDEPTPSSSHVTVAPPDTAEATGPPLRARFLVLVAVFLTGATSLAYEVAWSRGLLLVLGSTATTAALVLAAFVGALGLGARWGGPLADGHPRPLALYGGLELFAAAWAILTLPLIQLLQGPYVAMAGALPESLRLLPRALVAAVVVMPGAFLLGATLPALVRWWVGARSGAGRGTAWLYGVNTLGAVLGALGTGFHLVAALGVGGSARIAAAVAGVVGLAAYFAGRGGRTTPTVADSRLSWAPPRVRLVLDVRGASIAAALCGALGLGLEVAGFRLLVFFVEGFTVTFAAMVGVFIAGLALGSLILGPRLTRGQRPDHALAVVLGLTGASIFAVLVVVLSGGLESTLADVKAWAYGRAGFVDPIATGLRWTALIGSALVFLVPAFLLGATFPLCVRWAELAGLPPGRAVGRVYLYNSVGAILGPILVGFVLVPILSVETAWIVLAYLAVGAGAVIGFRDVRRSGARLAAVIVIFALVGVTVIFGHDDRNELVRSSHIIAAHPERTLLEVQSDPVTTASVVDDGHGQRILYTDDFAAAATGRHYRYMRMLGHLPVLLAESPEHALVIAFGTGTTAGAVAAHPEVKRIEVVEVSRAVLDLASYFAQANRNVLEDERTHVIRDDGRNALLLHAGDLDVITLEPLMPYSPAGLPFYTREFYELCSERLRDGGVVCQWVPVHAMSAGLYAAFVRTFFEVFPDGQLYFFEQSSALIWRKGGGALDGTALARRYGEAKEDLAEAGLGDVEALLATFVASGRRVLAAPEPLSSFTDRAVRDFDPYPEFHPTPRAPLNTTFLRDTLAWLASLVDVEDRPPAVRPELRAATRRALVARAKEADAAFLSVQRRARPALLPDELRAWEEAAAAYASACALLPGDDALVWRRVRAERRAARLHVQILASRARLEVREGRPGQGRALLREAATLARDAVALEDGDPLASERGAMLGAWAGVLLRLGRCGRAVEVLRASAQAFPRSRDRDELAAFHDVAERWYRHAQKPEQGPFAALFRDLPDCTGEGTAPVQAALDRYRGALQVGGPGRFHAAGDSLIQQARAEEVAGAVAVEASRWPAPISAEARASWAGVIAALDEAQGARLGGLLVHDDRTVRIAAVREAGRLRLLRRHPKTAEALAHAEEEDVRAALAEAAGGDGDHALLRLLPDLLLDRSRDVRLAAVSVLVPRFPDEMADYDPDGPEEARGRAAEKIRALLP